MAELRVIARLHGDLPDKFGVPRQSGLAPQLRSTIVFEPEFRSLDALRGLEDFSHIWLIWGFSRAERAGWSPTVRPPRLGGNARLGVFATRSPFRPNPLGLSSVVLEAVELCPRRGPVLHVLGADLIDGTPIYDIKPYLPYTDSHPEARGGFAQAPPDAALRVVIPPALLERLPPRLGAALPQLLAYDPRPRYHDDPLREYAMRFGGFEVRFAVAGEVLTVLAIDPEERA